MMVESTPSRCIPSERSVKEEIMGIISWIVVGLIAGLLAKLVLPGDDPGGLIVTTLIGMVGAVVGGFVFGIFGGTGATGFNVWSILVATVGAIILLFIYRLIFGRRTT
jgi:uncharacterized membrane protein YeaQ/YmgE (transglycosylase-associated protein family)